MSCASFNDLAAFELAYLMVLGHVVLYLQNKTQQKYW